MQGHRIVARFVDGRVLKGHTTNFSPTGGSFLLETEGAKLGTEPEVVELNLLKAVFFVRSFAGNPSYRDKKGFPGDRPYEGRRVEVTFADGEVMLGSTPNYDSSMRGFFVFPADPKSNTIKAFAISANVKKVRLL